MEQRDINRIKLVLVEKKRTAKWLAEELGPAAVVKPYFPLTAHLDGELRS